MAIKIAGTTVIHNNRAANNFSHIKTTGFISATGNVTANSFIGDGSQLTNAGSTVASDTSANRELLVPFTGITSGTMTSANVNSNFTFNPATGALSANAFIGDGSQLTNAGSTVASDTSANRELLVPFTGISSGTMTSANVNSNFTFNPATGALSANAFIGDGSQLTNAGSSVATDGGTNRELFVPFTGISSGTMTSANVDAQFTFNPGTETLSANSTATVFDVINDGVSAYQFNGGGTSTNNNPTLLLSRGKVYKFNVNASGHPFYIKTVNSTGTGNAYNDGVTNNGAQTGLVTFQVPNHAPSVLHYNCSVHAAMNGRIIIDSGFEYDETANAVFADSIKTRTLLDNSNRQLTIRDEANTIIWGN